MKQHITIEQIPNGENPLNEIIVDWLSANDEEQYFKLAAISQKTFEIYKETGVMREEFEFNKCFSEYFTIGKMIEILELNCNQEIDWYIGADWYDENVPGVTVSYGNISKTEIELCDCLFEVVIEVLNA